MILHQNTLKTPLQRSLGDAFEQNQFEVHWQFICDPRNRKRVGAEMLSRWNSPEEGLVLPENYVEAILNTDMKARLDFFMLDKACSRLEQLKKAGECEFWLTCNFSRSTIASDHFLPSFRETVTAHDFDHKNLVIEITESGALDDSPAACRNLEICKKDGFKIALDDFGSGNTSFRDLCDFPIDILKIDKQIVDKVKNARGKAVITGLCSLAHSLGMQVVCEGVETDDVNQAIIDCGCDLIQGFYYSRVVSENEAMKLYFSGSDS